MMKKLLFSTTCIICATLFPCSSFAVPEGKLYWVVDNLSDQLFFYNTTAPYNGAETAINYACQQNSGVGTYTGTVNMHTSGNNFPAQKGGWCRNQTIIGIMDGAYYSAYLHCNGLKREQMDASPCEPPQPTLDPAINFGPCSAHETTIAP